jgi:hypothetical protein
MEAATLRDQQQIIRLEQLRQEVDKRMDALDQATRAAQLAVQQGEAQRVSIVNLIDNSDFDWSQDRFLNNPVLGGDIDFECFNWFRHLTTDTLLIENAAHALKYAGHSLYAAAEGADGDIPRWDRPDGWPEIGAVGANQYDLVSPLPENFIQPGRGRIYLQFMAKRRTATALPAGIQVYGAFFDNTVGQAKVIEGGTFALVGVRIGAAGATSRQFKVIGTSDYGSQIESNVVTIADSVAVLSVANYVRLTMSGAVGFIQFDIYELVGGVCSRIGQIFNSINVSYNHYDIAPKANVGGVFPTVTLTKARAYAQTDDFEVSDSGWTLYDLTIPIPPTYASSATTGKQWFRLGLTAATADPRQVLFDKVGLSFGFGDWSPSARRPANFTSSTSLSGSDQGPPTGGGGPAGDGGGGPRCWLLDGCRINVLHGEKELLQSFDDLKLGERIVSNSIRSNILLSKSRHFVEEVFLVETANGLSHFFTATHRLRRNADDLHGTPVVKLEIGNSLITRPDKIVESTTITRLELMRGRFEVGSVALRPGHWLWVNGFGSHNIKLQENAG